MTDVDLVVAGAGGGLAGAVRAAELGLDVLVVEANPHYALGLAYLAAGHLASTGTRHTVCPTAPRQATPYEQPPDDLPQR